MKLNDTVVNNVAASPFQKMNLARVFRGAIRNVALSALLAWAALSTTDVLSILLWTWLGVRLFVLLFIGIASRAIEERERRFSQLPETYQKLLLTGSVYGLTR